VLFAFDNDLKALAAIWASSVQFSSARTPRQSAMNMSLRHVRELGKALKKKLEKIDIS